MIYDIYDLFLMESKIIDIFTLHKKIKDTYITHVLNRISFETVLSGRHFRLQKTGAVWESIQFVRRELFWKNENQTGYNCPNP